MHRPPCYAKKLRRWTQRRPVGERLRLASSRDASSLPPLSLSPLATLYSITYLRAPWTFIHADNRFWQRGTPWFRFLPRDLTVFVRNPCRADAIVATHGGNLLESPIVLCRMVAPKLPRIEPLSARILLSRDSFAALVGNLASNCPRYFMAIASSSNRCFLVEFGQDIIW